MALPRFGSPRPTVKIGMFRFAAARAASSALPRRSPPSEMSRIALWSSAAGSSASSAVLIAPPRSVSPRGAESGVAPSSAARRKPWSVVSGHSSTPVRRNATSAHRSPSSESMRSTTSAFARSRRFGLTSVASIERETSSATTTLRERAWNVCSEWPHCGRAAANTTSSSPARTSAACTRKSPGLRGIRRACSAGATKPSSRFSVRARSHSHTAPMTGTSARSANIQG